MLINTPRTKYIQIPYIRNTYCFAHTAKYTLFLYRKQTPVTIIKKIQNKKTKLCCNFKFDFFLLYF